jgi:hypothetical protein
MEPIINVVVVDGIPQFQEIASGFVALPGASGIAVASTDGEKWVKTVFGSSLLESDGGCSGMVNTQSPNAIFWSGNRYVVFVRPAQGLTCEDTVVAPTPQPMRFSMDGSTWRSGPNGLVGWIQNPIAVAWSGAKGLGLSGQYAMQAADDSDWSWNASYNLPGNPGASVAVSSTDSGFVVVGGGGGIWNSSNGGAWLARSSGTTRNLNAVKHASGWTIAVGDSGVLLISRDDSLWTAIPSGTMRDLRGIAANDSFIVVVGDTGTILRIPVASMMTDGIRTPSVAVSCSNLHVVAGRIELPPSASSTRERIALRIVGLDGTIRWNGSATSGSSLDVPRLPAGLYLLRAEGNGWRRSLEFAAP